MTFISTVSIGAVPMSDSWILRVSESENFEMKRMEGEPGTTVHDRDRMVDIDYVTCQHEAIY